MSNFLSRGVDRLFGKQKPATPPVISASEPPIPVEAQPLRILELDLSGVEKQIGKLGREQFKLNTLVELLQQQTQSAQMQFREQNEQHAKAVADLSASHQVTLKTEVTEARLQTSLRVLPGLDGLEEALASGERLLDRLRHLAAQYLPSGNTTPPYPATLLMILPSDLKDSLLQHADQANGSALQPAQVTAFDHAELAALHDTHAALLKGLGIVRTRLLDALAREGVQPIVAFGLPFDPNRHIAVDIVPSSPNTPPGNIASEARRGYIIGDRVLRYSEVIVARQVSDSQRGEAENTVIDIAMRDTNVDADADSQQNNLPEALVRNETT